MFGNDVLQLVYAFVIGIVPDAVINLQDVVANKPDEVREVRSSRLVGDKLQHSIVLHFVYVKRESPDGYPDHAFAVIEELNGLSIQREIVIVFIVEEVNGVLVEPEGESLEERDVVSHHLLVRKIKLVHDDGINVVVAQQVIDAGVISNVFKENVESLEKLNTDVVVSSFLIHELKEEREHVPLQKEIKNRAVILVSPDENLCNGADGLHQKPLVALRDRLVLG